MNYEVEKKETEWKVGDYFINGLESFNGTKTLRRIVLVSNDSNETIFGLMHIESTITDTYPQHETVNDLMKSMYKRVNDLKPIKVIQTDYAKFVREDGGKL